MMLKMASWTGHVSEYHCRELKSMWCYNELLATVVASGPGGVVVVKHCLPLLWPDVQVV